MTPILPLIPKKNADELLGSWFSRVASANKAATWNWLLRQCGYNERNQPPFDITGYDERYELLLSALGESYASSTSEMTTLPFWLFFEASRTDTIYDAEIRIPARDVAGRGASSQVVHGKMKRLKYCPCCLGEQKRRGIDPYWRRSHQLPTSVVCTQHKVFLRAACSSCGKIHELKKQRILKMPDLLCDCGVDLTASPNSCSDFAQRFVALSELTLGALKGGFPAWSRAEVVAAAQNVINEKWGGNLVKAFDAMEERFGLQRYKKYGLRLSNVEVDTTVPQLVLHGVPSGWGATTFASLFVTVDVGFVELRKELLKQKPVANAAGRQPRSSYFSTGILGAAGLPAAKKALAMRFETSGKLADLRAMATPFWLVYFHDNTWLRDLVGEGIDNLRVSGIHADRMAITDAIASGRVREMLRSPAFARARARDAQWFEATLPQEPTSKGPTAAPPLSAEKLQDALQRLLLSQQQPSRVTVHELALFCGTTAYIVKRGMSASPEFKRKFEQANANYPAERIRKGLDQLVVEQRKVGLAVLLRELTLNKHYARNYQLGLQILKEREEWAELVLVHRTTQFDPESSNPEDGPKS